MQVVIPDGRLSYVEQNAEPVRYFPLAPSMGEGQILVVNIPLGTLSLLENGETTPRLLIQQQFTKSELSLLVPLLEQFPHYCPYEVLYAGFYNGVLTEELIDQTRTHLQDAMAAGVLDTQMRPIRNVLSRIRFKLRGFDLDIVSILETGYILMITSRKKAA